MVGLHVWLPILLGVVFACPIFWYTGFELTPWMVVQQIASAGLGIASAWLLGRRARTRRIGTIISAFYQLMVVGGVGMMLAYSAATTGRPLVDETLLAIDQALHYEWSLYARFFVENRAAAQIVLLSYFTMMFQPVLLIVVLSAAHRNQQLEKFILASFVSILLTVSLFALYPATTAWAHLGLTDEQVAAYRFLPVPGDSWVRDLLRIRAGGGRSFADGFGSPIIAFPSLHCASGLLFVWAGWRVRWLRPILVAINGLMIAATPVIGGHYVADILGGAAVALAAVLITTRAYPWLVRMGQSPSFTRAPAPAPELAWSAPVPPPAAEAEELPKAA